MENKKVLKYFMIARISGKNRLRYYDTYRISNYLLDDERIKFKKWFISII